MTTRDNVERHETGNTANSLEQQLVERYGVLISNEALCHVLGYPSMSAFRQALKRRTVGVPVFGVPNRRGKFALTKDIADWLAVQRDLAASRLQQRTGATRQERRERS
jgi:hypothetical protein